MIARIIYDLWHEKKKINQHLKCWLRININIKPTL